MKASQRTAQDIGELLDMAANLDEWMQFCDNEKYLLIGTHLCGTEEMFAGSRWIKIEVTRSCDWETGTKWGVSATWWTKATGHQGVFETLGVYSELKDANVRAAQWLEERASEAGLLTDPVPLQHQPRSQFDCVNLDF
jgi:hypothetical protein